MKLKYFLLLLGSLFVVDLAPMPAGQAQVVIGSRPVQQTRSTSVYDIANPAVVTVYAGTEIGSGSIVTADGLVITNNHVVRGTPTGSVEVKLANGKRYAGRVIGIDHRNDLAIIQLKTSDRLPTIQLANSNSLQPGEPVYAIGSPYGRPGVMTTGTLGQIQPNGDLQSRVRLEPGNSGGPLLNARGEMIGVNKAVLETVQGVNTGISYATTARVARHFIEQYRPGRLPTAIAQAPTGQTASRTSSHPVPIAIAVPTLGNATQPAPPSQIARQTRPSPTPITIVVPPPDTTTRLSSRIPIAPRTPTLRSSTPAASASSKLGILLDIRNLMVQQVQTGSPAAIAGLKPGDRLLAVDGNPLRQFRDLQLFLTQHPDQAVFTISRNDLPTRVRIKF